MERSKPILVIQTAFLGDLLLSIPLLLRLKEKYPDSPLHLVCRKGFAKTLLDVQTVDYAYEVEKKNKKSYQAVIKQLHSTHFKMILSPHQSLTTALFVWQLQADQKISYRQWWNAVFYDQRVCRRSELPDAVRQLSLLSVNDVELSQLIESYLQKYQSADLGPVPEWASMSRSVILQSRSEAHLSGVQLDFSLPTICLFPGSVWATKQWVTAGYVELGVQLVSLGYQVVWLGSADEMALGQELADQVPGSQNWVGQTSLIQTLAILVRSRLVVANDSSGQHLAAVANVPTVSIFGPTIPAMGFRPWNPRARIVENKNLSCRPCGPHGHRACPLGHHQCMKSVSAAQVLSAIGDLIPIRR